MMRLAVTSTAEPYLVLCETWVVNEHIHQILLEHLDSRVWRVSPPGGKGRSIAAIFAHIHNIRRKWIRRSTPDRKLPAPLHRSRCTLSRARTALAQSARCCAEMLGSMPTISPAPKFLRDGWARPWPAGAAMVAYMISHEAHHRGQVCMLAHQLGFPLDGKVASAMWNWEKLWKECEFTRPR